MYVFIVSQRIEAREPSFCSRQEVSSAYEPLINLQTRERYLDKQFAFALELAPLVILPLALEHQRYSFVAYESESEDLIQKLLWQVEKTECFRRTGYCRPRRRHCDAQVPTGRDSRCLEIEGVSGFKMFRQCFSGACLESANWVVVRSQEFEIAVKRKVGQEPDKRGSHQRQPKYFTYSPVLNACDVNANIHTIHGISSKQAAPILSLSWERCGEWSEDQETRTLPSSLHPVEPPRVHNLFKTVSKMFCRFLWIRLARYSLVEQCAHRDISMNPA